MSTFPLEYVRLAYDGRLWNINQYVQLDQLAAESHNIVVSTANEVPHRGATILAMVNSISQDESPWQTRALARDEIDELCLEEVQKQMPDVDDLIRICAATGSPYSSPAAMQFCSRVLWRAKLGVNSINDVDPSEPILWVRMFNAGLVNGNQALGPNPQRGYANLHFEITPRGAWQSEVVYNTEDFASPQVREQHRTMTQGTSMYVILLHDHNGVYWAYITCQNEKPGGGNRMRLEQANAERLIDLGMTPYRG